MSNGLRTMSRDALNRTTSSLNKSSISNKSFKLPSYATCLQASIRPKTFQQLKFYLELAVKDKKVADMAYKTLSRQSAGNQLKNRAQSVGGGDHRIYSKTLNNTTHLSFKSRDPRWLQSNTATLSQDANRHSRTAGSID
jgi:hypothetical protein